MKRGQVLFFIFKYTLEKRVSLYTLDSSFFFPPRAQPEKLLIKSIILFCNIFPNFFARKKVETKEKFPKKKYILSRFKIFAGEIYCEK
jgi:hypothetical protein